LKYQPQKIVCGVDEAGRGAVLGPLVFAACATSKQIEEVFNNLGVKDSKQLSPSKREDLYSIITSLTTSWKTIHISAQDIDKRRARGENLNQISVACMLEVLSSLRETLNTFDELIIDSMDVLPKRLHDFLKPKFPSAHLIVEHSADVNYTIVGAASILAKVERDRAIRDLEKEHKIKLGSGYTSDLVTVEFLKSITSLPPSQRPSFIRASWNLTTVQDPFKNEKSGKK